VTHYGRARLPPSRFFSAHQEVRPPGELDAIIKNMTLGSFSINPHDPHLPSDSWLLTVPPKPWRRRMDPFLVFLFQHSTFSFQLLLNQIQSAHQNRIRSIHLRIISQLTVGVEPPSKNCSVGLQPKTIRHSRPDPHPGT
jgi:hypothetical protein